MLEYFLPGELTGVVDELLLRRKNTPAGYFPYVIPNKEIIIGLIAYAEELVTTGSGETWFVDIEVSNDSGLNYFVIHTEEINIGEIHNNAFVGLVFKVGQMVRLKYRRNPLYGGVKNPQVTLTMEGIN